MRYIISLLHSFIVYIYILLVTLTGSLLAVIAGVFNPYSNFNNSVIRYWAKSIIGLAGIRLQVLGIENIKEDKAYIFISNHIGAFDILALCATIPVTARFIAKKELFRIPVFAQGMRSVGMLKIDRGNSAEARKTLDKAVGTIKNGCSVIVFPEGHRSKTGELLKFKKGGFVLSINNQIPVIPTVMSGSQYIYYKGSHRIRSGKIKVQFLPAIDVSNISFEKRNELIEKTRNLILEYFEPEFNCE